MFPCNREILGGGVFLGDSRGRCFLAAGRQSGGKYKWEEGGMGVERKPVLSISLHSVMFVVSAEHYMYRINKNNTIPIFE